MLQQIVSGGQTGVDRAALDAAMQAGLSVGGWCPAGRRAADGPIDARYPLRETPFEDYEQRTAWNVRDSDATLILCPGEPLGGTALTLEMAQRLNRPVVVLDPGRLEAVRVARDWMEQHEVGVLNVAGPREEEVPGVYQAALTFIHRLLQRSSQTYCVRVR